MPDFVTITTSGHSSQNSAIRNNTDDFLVPAARDLHPTSVLIPIGGGKDSIVTIELLKQIPALETYALLINPTKHQKIL